MQHVTVPRETWDAMREALKHGVLEMNLSGKTKECMPLHHALTAANAVSHAKPETTPAPEGGAITSESAANAVIAEPKPVALQWVAEMIMSDCGCSTNNERLLERVIGRIEQYERANAPAHPQATEPAWIAVSDRLPEEDKRVLVWYRGHVSTTSLWLGSFITDSSAQPTHWMPLPAEPEAKQ